MSTSWAVPRTWDGQTAFIVAGGPSLKGQNLELLRGRNVIAVNRSYEDVPWAQYCFGMDGEFFNTIMPKLLPFAGACVSTAAVKSAKVLRLGITDQPGLSADPAKLACKLTSLQGAINLAVLLGSRPLVLVAADGRNGPEAVRAHKERYPGKGHREARYGDWRKRLEGVAAALAKLDIPVLNVSPDSAYADLWPTVATLEEAVA